MAKRVRVRDMVGFSDNGGRKNKAKDQDDQKASPTPQARSPHSWEAKGLKEFLGLESGIVAI